MRPSSGKLRHSFGATYNDPEKCLSPEIQISKPTMVPSRIRTRNSGTEIWDGSACTTVEPSNFEVFQSSNSWSTKVAFSLVYVFFTLLGTTWLFRNRCPTVYCWIRTTSRNYFLSPEINSTNTSLDPSRIELGTIGTTARSSTQSAIEALNTTVV